MLRKEGLDKLLLWAKVVSGSDRVRICDKC